MLLRAEHVPMHVRFMLGIMNAASHGCVPKLDAMRSDEHMARHMRDQPVVTQRQRVLLLALGWPWGAWSEVHAVKHHRHHQFCPLATSGPKERSMVGAAVQGSVRLLRSPSKSAAGRPFTLRAPRCARPARIQTAARR